MKKFFSLLLALLIITNSFGIEIKTKDVIKNKQPGYCVWTSLETLANTHNIEELKGIQKKREDMGFDIHIKNNIAHTVPAAYGFPDCIVRELTDVGVNYLYQSSGNKTKALLKKYADKQGLVFVIFILIKYKDEQGVEQSIWGRHALIMGSFTDKEVKYYDTNNPGFVYTAKMEWFDKYWDGQVIVINP